MRQRNERFTVGVNPQKLFAYDFIGNLASLTTQGFTGQEELIGFGLLQGARDFSNCELAHALGHALANFDAATTVRAVPRTQI